MNMLIDELEKIDTKLIPRCPEGKTKTLEEFWNIFRPTNQYIANAKEWHRILMDYIKLPHAIFPIRYDYDSQKWRGLITIIEAKNENGKIVDSFSYFNTDNEHAKYYYSLCLAGNNINNARELWDPYNFRLFPLSIYSKKETKKLIAFPKTLKHICATKGYWLAHILAIKGNAKKKDDVPYYDKKYLENPIVFKDFMNKYLHAPDVKIDNWNQYSEGAVYGFGNNHNMEYLKEHPYFYRKLEITSKDSILIRKFLAASFLRYVHPFNYFLSPNFSTWTGKEAPDNSALKIGEERVILDYFEDKFSKIFNDPNEKDGRSLYEEFLDNIMIEDRFRPSGKAENKDFQVKYYSSKEKMEKDVIGNNQQAKHAEKFHIVSSNTMKVGKLANINMREILERGSVSPEEIDKLQDKEYCRKVFKQSSYPVLVRTDGQFENGRYYTSPIKINGVEYRLCSQWDERRNRSSLENWINCHK